MPAPSPRLVVGCMTGTSLDGLDAALVEIHGHGLEMTAHFRGMVSKPLGPLANQLRHLAEGRPAPPLDYLRAARQLGQLHAEAVSELLLKSEIQNPKSEISFIVAHGQTIHHAPSEHLSFQLFDPWPLVRQLQLPVCYDLRQADLIAGGQGAPLTPIADWVMYRDRQHYKGAMPDRFGTLVLNLGGICNATYIPPDSSLVGVEAADIGPCNLLLDGLTQLLFPPMRFDENGILAAAGHARPMFHKIVREHSPFYHRNPRTSTGREDFRASVIAAIARDATAKMPPRDVLASAVLFITAEIKTYAQSRNARLIAAGGGAKNPLLVARLKCSISEIPVEAREAMAFAVLGALSQDGVPISLPQVTGAKNPARAGAWAYP